MTIEYSPHLGLSEFEAAALKKHFLDLIRVGELRRLNSDEFVVNYENTDNLYVLAPKWVEDEETGDWITVGYILMTAEEWDAC